MPHHSRTLQALAEENESENGDEQHAELVDGGDVGGGTDFERAEVAHPRRAGGQRRGAQEGERAGRQRRRVAPLAASRRRTAPAARRSRRCAAASRSRCPRRPVRSWRRSRSARRTPPTARPTAAIARSPCVHLREGTRASSLKHLVVQSRGVSCAQAGVVAQQPVDRGVAIDEPRERIVVRVGQHFDQVVGVVHRRRDEAVRDCRNSGSPVMRAAKARKSSIVSGAATACIRSIRMRRTPLSRSSGSASSAACSRWATETTPW